VDAGERERDELSRRHAGVVAGLETHYTGEVGKLTAALRAAQEREAADADTITTLTGELAGARNAARDAGELRATVSRLSEGLDAARAEAKNASERAALAAEELRELRAAHTKQAGALKAAGAEVTALRGSNAAQAGEVAALKAARDAEARSAKELFTKKMAESKAAWDTHYKEKLAQLERQLRAEYDAEMKELRAREKTLRETVDRLRIDYAKAAADAAKNQEFANELTARLYALEEAHKDEHLRFEQAKADFEGKLGRALAEKAAKVDEFNRLMDVKITLQAEIMHYRRILEEEEVRTGIPTPASNGPKSRSALPPPPPPAAAPAPAAAASETGAASAATPATGARSARKSSWLNLFGFGGGAGSEDGDPVAAVAASPVVTAAALPFTSPLPPPPPPPAAPAAVPALASGGSRRTVNHRRSSVGGAAPAAPAPPAAASTASGRKRKSAGAAPAAAAAPAPAPVHGAGTGLLDDMHDDDGGDNYDPRFDAAEALAEAAAAAAAASPPASPPRTSSAAKRARASTLTHSPHPHKTGTIVTRGMESRGIADAGKYSGAEVKLEVDLSADVVRVTNKTTSGIDMSGWVLVSEVGDQRYTFPDLLLLGGAAVTIWSGPVR